MHDLISAVPAIELDYARIVHADNLGDMQMVDLSHPESAVALVAARVGTTRLIDNIMLPGHND
jgi:pantothenate synthetase